MKMPHPTGQKVFWFFFSKKNRFLPAVGVAQKTMLSAARLQG
jgi:hypothetical protein